MKNKFFLSLLLSVIVFEYSIAQTEFATRRLSNLQPTKINRSLIALSNDSLDLGSATLGWQNLYLTKGIYFSGVRGFYATGTNTGIGLAALNSVSTGTDNTSVGYNAAFNNTTGNYNSSIGKDALYSNLVGNSNTAVGRASLYSNTVGNSNTAVGYKALASNTEGDNNTAVGYEALTSNKGDNNTANGLYALYSNTSGSFNTAFGRSALFENTTANGNTALGYSAGNSYANSDYNTFLGYDADAAGNYTKSTAVGQASRITASYQVRVGSGSTTSIGGYKGWSVISDGRFKKNVAENVIGLAFINKLRPVTYSLDIHAINAKTNLKEDRDEAKMIADNEKIIYSGLIAQEVEKVSRETGFSNDIVDKPKNENDMYGIRYAELVVPLIKAVQELSAENDKLKNRLEKIEALLVNQLTINLSEDLKAANSSINVYPNPVKNTLYINSKTNAIFSLSDVLGKVVATKQINSDGSIDVSKLAGGIYFLKNNTSDEVMKVVIQK